MPKVKAKPVATPVSPDVFLRDQGFRIAARPDRGEAVWERRGRHYPQSAALQLANEEWGRAVRDIEQKFGGM